jgi:hypothetical protein
VLAESNQFASTIVATKVAVIGLTGFEVAVVAPRSVEANRADSREATATKQGCKLPTSGSRYRLVSAVRIRE